MATATVTIPREEYLKLKKKAELDDSLLMSLVRGLEDIKAGKIKPWKGQ
jgi:hypothetical protein